MERYTVSGSVVFDNADAIVRSAIAGLANYRLTVGAHGRCYGTGNYRDRLGSTTAGKLSKLRRTQSIPTSLFNFMR